MSSERTPDTRETIGPRRDRSRARCCGRPFAYCTCAEDKVRYADQKKAEAHDGD